LPAPAAYPTLPGYEILGVLGRGGMGVVYKARQVQLKRLVALKMILSGSHADPQELARFVAEGEAVARLQHPNVVQIYEVGEWQAEAGGTPLPFFSLEFVEGGTLAARLAGTPLAARESAELTAILALAVEAAHQAGVVHRDLKPANVLLTGTREEGTGTRGEKVQSSSLVPDLCSLVPKITDFGLAKQLDQDSGQTRTGVIMGTPSYMSPEQAAGKTAEVGPPADVYALGAILYECLTGRPPFRAATALETLEQVRSEEPVSPSRLQPKTPCDLEIICLKCLQKTVGKRYPTARELAEDLHRFLAGEPIHARSASRAERLWRWWRRKPYQAAAVGLAVFSVVAVLLLAVAAVFTLELREQQKQTEKARDEAETQRGIANQQRDLANEATRRANILAASQAIDQHLLVCDKGDVSRGLLRLARALATSPEGADELRHVSRMNLSAWSRQLAPIVAVIPTPPRAWPGNTLVSPDGKRLLIVSGGQQAQLWDALTGRPVGEPLRDEAIFTSQVFSPDGGTVLTANTEGTVRFWDAGTGKARGEPLMTDGGVMALYYSPNGKTFLTTGRVMDRLWNAATRQPIGEPLPHAEQLSYQPPVFSPDGRILLTRSDNIAGGDVITTFHLWETTTGKLIGKPLTYHPFIDSLLFSPDGRFLLVGSSGVVMLRKIAQLVDTATAKAVDMDVSLLSSTGTAAFSPDSRYLASAGADGLVRLVDLATGKPRGDPFQAEDTSTPASVMLVKFSPNGQTILTGHWDNTARLWSLATGEPVGELLRHEGNASYGFTPSRKVGGAAPPKGIVAAAFAPGGGVVMTAGADQAVRFWNAATGKPLARPLPHLGAVTGFRLSPDGRLGVSETAEGSGWIWETDTGRPLGLTPQHQGPSGVKGYGFGGRTVLTGGRDGFLRLLETSGPSALARSLPHTSHVSAVAFSPDGRTALTGTAGGSAHLWDTATGKPVGKPLQEPSTIIALGFSPDGQTTWTRAWRNTARLWNAATGDPVGPAVQGVQTTRFGDFSPDGRLLFTWDKDSDWLCELATGRRIANLRVPGQLWWKAVFSPDSRTVLTGSNTGAAQLWDALTGKPIGPLLRHNDAITFMTFSPDGKTALTCSSDARLWETATGRSLGKPLQHRGLVAGAAFSPDGKTVLTGCEDQTAQFWDAATGEPLGRPLPHEDYVWTVAFAPGGRVALTGTRGRTYHLWEVATRKPIGPPLQHQGQITDVAFSPDGHLLLTSSADGTARLWDTATGKPVGPRLEHSAPIDAVAFSPVGNAVLTGGKDGWARLWPVPAPLTIGAEDAVLWAEVCTGMELDADGVPRWLGPAQWQERRERLEQASGKMRRQ
jgi:WD40 repeat protein